MRNTPAVFGPDDVPGIARSNYADGYRGIWYALGFKFEYGDKYSGGLGTYTASHQPMAVYASAVEKTFFTYGGTTASDKRELVIMVGMYDHKTGRSAPPVALFCDPAVDDPHDNASIHLDKAGFIWIFKSGRGAKRPGIIFRSVQPYALEAFELVAKEEFTYPQIWIGPAGGDMFLLFTKYRKGTANGPARCLYWKTSPDGRTWSEDHALAAFGGHYQTSGSCTIGATTKYATFFNWHPESHVDRRTNVYYAETIDGGQTWTTAAGTLLSLPLLDPENPALVLDLKARDRFMYSCDLAFDQRANPVLLFIVSRAGEPGPSGDPREWTLLHWMDEKWQKRVVTHSDHNYDMGSLFIDGDEWRIIGPTETGPQAHATGGEMALWISRDAGCTWEKERNLTSDSSRNHSYARRSLHGHPDFAAFWADGDANQFTESHLYFTDINGERVQDLPREGLL